MATSWEQALVNASAEVSRACWMMNRPGQVPPEKIDREYCLKHIGEAIKDLKESERLLIKERLRYTGPHHEN